MTSKRKLSQGGQKNKKTKLEDKEEPTIDPTPTTPTTNSLNTMPKFRKGAIRKISVKNFMTYDDVSFEPGPGLNLVLGPNGTGKSSIVSAICLGLNGKPTLLGRASKADGYIKHGKQDAFVEIELEGDTNEKRIIIRREWKKDSTATLWKLNGKKSDSRVIEDLVDGLNIKLDNLTQFLPQDRVAEFAGLGPIELLKSTQEAVLPPEMANYHQQLIVLKKKQVEDARKITDNEVVLETLKKKNATLEKDVELFNRRKKHLEKVEQLTLKKPFVTFQSIQTDAKTVKTQKDQAEEELADYEEKMKPLAAQIQQKKKSIDDLEQQRNQLRQELRKNNKVDQLSGKIEDNMNKVNTLKMELAELYKRQNDRENQKARLVKIIEKLTSDLSKMGSVDSFNEQIKTKNDELNDYDRHMSDKKEAAHEYNSKIIEAQRDRKQYSSRLEELNSVTNRRLDAIRQYGTDGLNAYDCWNWIRKNMDNLTQQVYFLPLEISVPDSLHAKYLEFQCPKYLLLSFVTQNAQDRKYILTNYVDKYKKDITVINYDREFQTGSHPVKLDGKGNGCGVTMYLDQTFSAPPIIKSVLEDTCQISKAGIGSSSTTLEDCLKYLPEVKTIYTPESRFVVKYSRYDTSHSSTSVLPMKESKIFIGVDLKQKDVITSKLEEISGKIKNWDNTKSEIDKEIQKITSKREEVKAQVKAIQNRKKDVATLEAKIIREKENLEEFDQEDNIAANEAAINKKIILVNRETVKLITEFSSEMKKYHEVILKETALPFKLGKAQEELRQFMSQESEFQDSLRSLQRKVSEQTARLDELKRDLTIWKERATTARNNYEAKYRMTSEEVTNILLKLPDDIVNIDLQIDQETEAANRIVNDPNVIREYEKQKEEIDSKTKWIEDQKDLLTKQEAKMKEILDKWEPTITECVEKVNGTFIQYCKNIGITGEVGLLKQEDYAQWAIQIQVKFRDNEQLNVLSSFRQSGGERSVTTMLYLLALQEVNKCPLRVVDEINQGMDPINERKIFLQMLEASRGEDVPQSFLITPKLLSDLVPNDCGIITVLFIYNGPHNLCQQDLLNDLK